MVNGPLYAGQSRRLAAFFLDALVFSIPGLFVYGLLVREERSLAWLLPAVFAAGWIYNAGLHASPLQATLGKAMFAIKVTDLRGDRLRLGRASTRFLAAWLSALPLMIGFLRIDGTTGHQAIHDRIAGTLVVRRDASPAEVRQGGGVMEIEDTGGIALAGALVVLFLVPAIAVNVSVHYSMTTRTKVQTAIYEASTARPDVERLIAEGRLPAPGTARPLPAASPHVASLQVNHAGRIALAMKGLMPSANGHVYFTPRTGKDGKIDWTCTSEGVRPYFLPATCRP